LKQAQHSPLKIEEQVVSIFAGVNGYLDKIATTDVTRFEEQYLNEMRGKHADVLATIASEKKLSDETIDKLKTILTAFAKSFS